LTLEFKGYAFTLAYHLYSRDRNVMRDRAERYLADEEARDSTIWRDGSARQESQSRRR
jgi:hypothetical protein